jgi:hypothetical protein
VDDRTDWMAAPRVQSAACEAQQAAHPLSQNSELLDPSLVRKLVVISRSLPRRME